MLFAPRNPPMQLAVQPVDYAALIHPTPPHVTRRLCSSFIRGAVQTPHDLAYTAPMTTITLENTQADLPALVKRVLDGEEIVIEADERKIRLTAVPPPPSTDTIPQRKSYRGRGALKGQLVVRPEFFEPLSDEECGVAGDPGAK